MEENARRMKERMERLSEKQAATRKNLEDATAGYEAAAANLQAAEEGVKAARMYVSYSSVTAPFDGTIVEKRVEAGDTAAPGMPLFTIEDSSKVKIEASVPESLAAGLVPGSPVEVEIEAAGGGRRAATIAEVLPDADPRSRTVIVRIVLDNADGAIRSGSFARLRIPTGQNPATGGDSGRAAATSGPPPAAPSPAVLFVPDTALVHQGPLAGLFVVDGSGVARLRWVTAGRSAGGATEILTGLLPGETFVVEPPAGLADGRRVESR
jgi:RND family efflux transporter MFP subunit